MESLALTPSFNRQLESEAICANSWGLCAQPCWKDTLQLLGREADLSRLPEAFLFPVGIR